MHSHSTYVVVQGLEVTTDVHTIPEGQARLVKAGMKEVYGRFGRFLAKDCDKNPNSMSHIIAYDFEKLANGGQVYTPTCSRYEREDMHKC